MGIKETIMVPETKCLFETTSDAGYTRELNRDFYLRDLNIIYNLMTTAFRSNQENIVELPGWGPEDCVEPDNCLAKICGLEGHMCGGLGCVKTLLKHHKQLKIVFKN